MPTFEFIWDILSSSLTTIEFGLASLTVARIQQCTLLSAVKTVKTKTRVDQINCEHGNTYHKEYKRRK